MKLRQLGIFWESFSSIQRKGHRERDCFSSLAGTFLVEYGPDLPCMAIERLPCKCHFFCNFFIKVILLAVSHRREI